MEAFNQFFNLFQEVWFQGIFGINVSEIIIGLFFAVSFVIIIAILMSNYKYIERSLLPYVIAQ